MPDKLHSIDVPHTAWYVSPDRHTQADLHLGDFERRVEILESQFRGWFFDHANLLWSEANPKREHSGFAVVTLMTTYIEAIAEFLSGKDSTGNSKKFFKRGFRAVFPDLGKQVTVGDPEQVVDEIAEAFYTQIRCGLFHTAATRRRVQLVWGMKAGALVISGGISEDAQTGRPVHDIHWIYVEPAAYAKSIEGHFNGYVEELRASQPGSEIRERFQRAFALRTGLAARSSD